MNDYHCPWSEFYIANHLNYKKIKYSHETTLLQTFVNVLGRWVDENLFSISKIFQVGNNLFLSFVVALLGGSPPFFTRMYHTYDTTKDEILATYLIIMVIELQPHDGLLDGVCAYNNRVPIVTP